MIILFDHKLSSPIIYIFMELLQLFWALCLLAITVISWHFVNCIWLKPKKLERFMRQQGFGGNPYRLISGDAPEISKMTDSALSKNIPISSHDVMSRVMPFELQTIQQHGDNSFVWNGRTPKVTIMKPEIIRKILAQYEVFRKQPPGTRSKFGLVLRDGEEWAKVRRVMNSAFHMEKLKRMLPLMEASCDIMLRKWGKMVSSDGTCTIDVFASLRTMAADVIARTAFGSSYEEGKRLFQVEDESILLKFQNFRSFGYKYIPGWRYIPIKINREIKKLVNETEKLVKIIIDNRKRAMKQGSDSTFKDDLLSVMLEANEKDKEENGVGISMEELIVECRLFMLAGKDTVATLMTWTMVLLSQHKDWQTKARDEIWQHFGKDESPDADSLNQLKIVRMILNETLRLYPPVTAMGRVIGQDTKLMNLCLTHDMEVSLPTILVHRDPKIWGDDADEFNPARFSGGIASANKVLGSYIPFSSGPRICIGQHFALIEAKLTLAKILQQFSFELSPTYVHAPMNYTSLIPQFGAPLSFKKL